MKKYLKLTGLSLMLLGAVMLSGCGDEKKPEPQKPAATTTTTTQPTSQQVRVTSGPNWRYPGYIKYQEDTPKVTSEIQRIVNECHAQAKLHASANGKFLNDSKINKNDQRKVRDLHFHAKGVNHNDKIKFKNSKGKEVYQQEVYHIYFTVDKDTSAIKTWRFEKYVVNEQMPDGKTIILKKL